jgi:molybdate/tungstate transport system substrate-binding protein
MARARPGGLVRWIAVAVAVVVLAAVLALIFGNPPQSTMPTTTPPATSAQTTTMATTPTSTTSVAATSSAKCSGDVLGYIAPMLIKITRDAARQAGLSTGAIQSIGSVEGLRRMQQGAVPDIYGSVDVELLPDIEKLKPRQTFVLGGFSLGVVCREPLNSPDDLTTRTLVLADPNKAPIGYRAPAAAWMLKKDGAADLMTLFEKTGIKYVETPRGVNITIPTALTPTDKVQIAPNLDAAWSMLESGAADCSFTYFPFVIGKLGRLDKIGETSLWTMYKGAKEGKEYYAYFFKGPYSFVQDPPYEIYALFMQGDKVAKVLRVGRFAAFVASFSEKGDCVVDALKRMNLAAYGFVR